MANFLSNVIKDFQSKRGSANDVAIVRINKVEKTRKIEECAETILRKVRAVTLTQPLKTVLVHRNLRKTSLIVVPDIIRCFIHKSS